MTSPIPWVFMSAGPCLFGHLYPASRAAFVALAPGSDRINSMNRRLRSVIFMGKPSRGVEKAGAGIVPSLFHPCLSGPRSYLTKRKATVRIDPHEQQAFQ